MSVSHGSLSWNAQSLIDFDSSILIYISNGNQPVIHEQALNAFVDDLVVKFHLVGRSDLKTTTRIEIIVNPVNDPPYFESLPVFPPRDTL